MTSAELKANLRYLSVALPGSRFDPANLELARLVAELYRALTWKEDDSWDVEKIATVAEFLGLDGGVVAGDLGG